MSLAPSPVSQARKTRWLADRKVALPVFLSLLVAGFTACSRDDYGFEPYCSPSGSVRDAGCLHSTSPAHAGGFSQGSNSAPAMEEIPRTVLPGELVGTWNGGPGDSSDYWLTLNEDGQYTLTNDELNITDRGYAASNGRSLTLTSQLTGTKITQTWSVQQMPESIGSFTLLKFGTSSYIRE